VVAVTTRERVMDRVGQEKVLIGLTVGWPPRLVVVVFAQSTIPRLHMLLQVLRETLHCKLPIEIYHFPDEMKDEKVRADLVAWGGVKVVEVSVGARGWV
jgi:hypothetical protein